MSFQNVFLHILRMLMLLIRPTGQGTTLLSDVMRDFKSAILIQTAWNQFAKRTERGTISPSVKVLCNILEPESYQNRSPTLHSWVTRIQVYIFRRELYFSVVKYMGKK